MDDSDPVSTAVYGLGSVTGSFNACRARYAITCCGRIGR